MRSTKLASKRSADFVRARGRNRFAKHFTRLCRKSLIVLCLAIPVTSCRYAGAQPRPLRPVQSVFADGTHTCAVMVTGGVKCWGLNKYGQLGTGPSLVPGVFSWSSHATNVVGLSSGVLSLALGFDHTCALTIEGKVKCWGYNADGEIGSAASDVFRMIKGVDSPRDVVGIPDRVLAIDAGEFHTCALTVSTEVRCWGMNSRGDLGTTRGGGFFGTGAHEAVAVAGLDRGVSKLALGAYHSCALTQGVVKCWGDNAYGQLGDLTQTSRPMPANATALSEPVSDISAGDFFTCALTQRGAVKCWGDNSDGQLGGASSNRIVLSPTNVIGLATGVSMIACGDNHSCALLTDGSVRCWGRGIDGQLGNGATPRQSVPVIVEGLHDVIAVAAGGSHSCAVLKTGGVKCWGANGGGQLGDGTISAKASPVDVLTYEQ